MVEGTLDVSEIWDAPHIYSNWLAAEKGLRVFSIYEYPLLTDARIIGHTIEGYGPYKFINPKPSQEKIGLIKPSIILRINAHVAGSKIVDFCKKRSIELIYEGGAQEQIATLTSLALGVRIKAGGCIRIFSPLEEKVDPLGVPIGWHDKPYPILQIDQRGLVLPNVVGPHSLEDLKPFSQILSISPENIVALIRAAKLYQDALWIAESEPALSWLMFVSALETAANQWRKEKDNHIERFKNFKEGRLFELLTKYCDQEIINNVASLIADSLGSTKKFIDFVIEFLPGPPAKRPPPDARMDWSKQTMKKILDKIYQYRSDALHEGTPFPDPMCSRPTWESPWEAPAEKYIGGVLNLTMDDKEKIWFNKKFPILLNTFEYITRGTLIKWWKSISTNQMQSVDRS